MNKFLSLVALLCVAGYSNLAQSAELSLNAGSSQADHKVQEEQKNLAEAQQLDSKYRAAHGNQARTIIPPMPESVITTQQKPSAHIFSSSISDAHRKQMLSMCPDEVTEIVELLKNRDSSASKDIPKKILFVGPAGTGKTTLAKAIAGSCNMPCFMCPGSLIANHFHNSGNENLTEIFSEMVALNKPCVVVIDELQTLINKHKNTRDNDANMLTSLWSLLDEYEDSPILFIGILNHANGMPEQLIGRFEDVIELTLPNEPQREKIIQYNKELHNNVPYESSFSVAELAATTQGFSYRNIEKFMSKAVRKAIVRNLSSKSTADCSPVTMQDCLQAIKDIRSAPNKIKQKIKLAKLVTQVGPYVISALGIGVGIFLHKQQMAENRKLHAAVAAQNKQLHALNLQHSEALFNKQNSVEMARQKSIIDSIIN